jgi:hypothetical protein
MHPLVPAILLRVARLDPFDLNPEAEPPHGQLAQPVERLTITVFATRYLLVCEALSSTQGRFAFTVFERAFTLLELFERPVTNAIIRQVGNHAIRVWTTGSHVPPEHRLAPWRS